MKPSIYLVAVRRKVGQLVRTSDHFRAPLAQPSGLGDPAYRGMHLQSILKNLSLCGGALAWAGIFAASERRDLVEPAPPIMPADRQRGAAL